MQPSPRILAFIQGFEKLRLVTYLPTPHDKPTKGWGHTGADVKLGDAPWTREYADQVFDSDVGVRASWLNKQLYGVPTTQGQFDALLSLVFNIGTANLGGSSLLRYHKLGLSQKAADEFLKWDHQAGKVLPGLTKRRTAERLIYLS